MLSAARETYQTAVILIFDVEDVYARDVRFQDRHPRPIEPLDFWLVGKITNGIRADFAEPAGMAVQRNSTGYHLFFGELHFAGGQVQRSILEPGTYVVRISGPAYQPAERADIVVPMPEPNAFNSGAPYAFDLQPGYGYPFPPAYGFRPLAGAGNCAGGDMRGSAGPTLLRGCLFAPDGSGLAGARVQAVGFPAAYLTDATGQWVLPFGDSNSPIGLVTIRVQLPDGTTVDATDVCVARGRETRLGVTALRGTVRNAGQGVVGAVITVAGFPAQTMSRDGGAWTYYFGVGPVPASVSVTATLPDGASKSLNGAVTARATAQGPVFQFP